MSMPYLQAGAEQLELQNQFMGLHARKAADGAEFWDERNMSADEFPMLAPRKRRRLIRHINGGTLLGGEQLAWIADGQLWYGGKMVYSPGEGGTELTGEQQLIRMGAYLICWPAGIVYNTHDGTLRHIREDWTGDQVHVRPCMLSGQELNYIASETAPEDALEGSYWLNTETNGLYQLLAGTWTGLDTVYSRLEGAGIGAMFSDYDVVSLSGFDFDSFNLDAATIYARGEDYIVIASGVVTDFVNQGTVVVSRNAPELDEIVECNNRIWGYSKKTHEIRCSKLGDPLNWNSYLGISTDSYAATVGSQGAFTGICVYMGYVHFWKENRVHRLYGTQPSNFQLTELQVRGVKPGCGKSLCVVNELLFYMSDGGMIRYDGSGPVDIGQQLGEEPLEDVVCGRHAGKLYVSAIQEGAPAFYTFDVLRGLWHREDDTRAVAFAGTEDGDYFLDDTGTIWGIDGSGSALESSEARLEEDISWWAETGDMLVADVSKKTLKRLTLRLEMERGAQVQVDVQYDSDGRWHRVLSYQTENKKLVTLPIVARHCDHLRLRYSGTGAVVIYMLGKVFESREAKRNCWNYRA